MWTWLSADILRIIIEMVDTSQLSSILRLEARCKPLVLLRLSCLQPLATGRFKLPGSFILGTAKKPRKQLVLSSRQLGDAELHVLAAGAIAGAFLQIQELTLTSNEIRAHGIQALADASTRGAFPNVRRLTLNSNPIGDDGCTALATACTAGAFARLESLSLNLCDIGDVGITALGSACSAGALVNLTHLRLAGNRVTDAASTLASPTALPNLLWLSFYDNHTSYAGILQFFQTCTQVGSLPQVQEVHFTLTSSRDEPFDADACNSVARALSGGALPQLDTLRLPPLALPHALGWAFLGANANAHPARAQLDVACATRGIAVRLGY